MAVTGSKNMSFEPGALPAGGVIPLCVPEIRGREWEYVKDCLDTGWVSSVGSYVERFESGVAARAGQGHGVAVVNGTAALHMALKLAGVGPGDEVVMPSLTFIAPANAVHYLGAHPVFADAEPDYWQMDVEQVRGFLADKCEVENGVLRNRSTGRRVAALLPVHILGHPVEMGALMELSERFGLPVVEDATESLGGTWRGRPLGGIGHFGCFSFNGNKILTTGGGGVLVARDKQAAVRARYFTTQAKDDPVEYRHEEVGYNYRLTNLQAAMGCGQLENLEAYVEAKRRIAQRYAAAFEGRPGLCFMREASWAHSAFWMSTVRVDPGFGGGSRNLMHQLGMRGIQTRPLWQPLHLSGAHRGAFHLGCSVAEGLWRDALSIPCSVGLTEEDQERVITEVLMASCRSRMGLGKQL